MGFLLFLSDLMIPLIIFYIVGFGILGKRQVFDDFLWGAKEGMGTVVGTFFSGADDRCRRTSGIRIFRIFKSDPGSTGHFSGASGANYPHCLCASDLQLRRCGSVIGLV